MTDALAPIAVAVAFLAAGTVKGVIGMGLPPIALALMTLSIGLPQAMALIIVPSLATNLWQAAAGGHARAILARQWRFLAAAMATVWLGVRALDRLDPVLPSVLLGTLLALYGAAGLAGVRPAVPRHHHGWAGVAVGAVNGLMTGLTGVFSVPGVFWLQAIGLPRDALIQAMGILFAGSTVALALALGGHDRLTPGLALASAVAVVPALLGMVAGRRWRGALSEATFRRLFHGALIALGAAIAARAVTFGS